MDPATPRCPAPSTHLGSVAAVDADGTLLVPRAAAAGGLCDLRRAGDEGNLRDQRRDAAAGAGDALGGLRRQRAREQGHAPQSLVLLAWLPNIHDSQARRAPPRVDAQGRGAEQSTSAAAASHLRLVCRQAVDHGHVAPAAEAVPAGQHRQLQAQRVVANGADLLLRSRPAPRHAGAARPGSGRRLCRRDAGAGLVVIASLDAAVRCRCSRLGGAGGAALARGAEPLQIPQRAAAAPQLRRGDGLVPRQLLRPGREGRGTSLCHFIVCCCQPYRMPAFSESPIQCIYRYTPPRDLQERLRSCSPCCGRAPPPPTPGAGRPAHSPTRHRSAACMQHTERLIHLRLSILSEAGHSCETIWLPPWGQRRGLSGPPGCSVYCSLCTPTPGQAGRQAGAALTSCASCTCPAHPAHRAGHAAPCSAPGP